MELLQRRFNYDAEELYVEMARAALEVFSARDPAFGIVPEISKWNFIADHFFDGGQKELGILLAMNLVNLEPTNSFLICKLAQLYRESELSDKAVELCRNSPPMTVAQRPFFNEWAVCEGSAGNYALNVWLDGLCLSDQAERRRLDSQTAPITLAGLSLACFELFTLHPNDKIYIDACAAASQLGLALKPQQDTRRNLESNAEEARRHGARPCSIEEGLQIITRAISLAWEYREAEMPDWIPAHEQLSFTELFFLF